MSGRSRPLTNGVSSPPSSKRCVGVHDDASSFGVRVGLASLSRRRSRS
jgi:hypothetical protein